MVITGQLEDEKAVRASMDLKVTRSSNFVASYAIKYAWKAEQKEYGGNVNETTGEITDLWVGRYWGASRAVRNEKVYASTNVQAVRVVRRWMGKHLRRKSFSGIWLMLKPELRDRVMTLCDDLDRAEISCFEHNRLEGSGWRRNDPYRIDLRWRDEKVVGVRGVDDEWERRQSKRKAKRESNVT